MALNSAQKIALDTAFQQLLRQGNFLPNGLPFQLSQIANYDAINTQSDMTFWVDGTSGDDSAPGDQQRPLRTINAAFQRVPMVVQHIVNIFVKRGTYAETILDYHIYNTNISLTSLISIEGVDFDLVSLSGTKLNSGTATQSGYTLTVTLGSHDPWTVSELRGCMLQITSGTNSGALLPIADNGTNTITVPITSGFNVNGASFKIVNHAAVITRGANQFYSVYASNLGAWSASAGLRLKNLAINSGSFYGIYQACGAVRVDGCKVSGASSSGIFTFLANCSLLTLSCFIQGSGTGTGIRHSLCGDSFHCRTVINGGGRGLWSASHVSWGGVSASNGYLWIQNASTAGLHILGPWLGFTTFSNAPLVLKNNAVGLMVESGSSLLLQLCEITGNTSHGIYLRADDLFLGHNNLNIQACKISSNGGDGIRIDTSHNSLLIDSATEISSNTGKGIVMGATGSLLASHNSAWMNSDTTMTGNGADLSLDAGVSTSTIANLRAQTPKVLVDSTRFNRFAGA